MDKTLRLECTKCGKTYHVFEAYVPADVEYGEAFQVECAYCEEGRYAVLVKELQKKTSNFRR